MKMLAAKVLIAVLAIGAIVVGAASQVAPGLAWWKVLLGAAVLALILFVGAWVHALVAGSIRSALLRWGAIDPQWLWTPDYPEGFKRYFRRRSERDIK